MNLNKVRIKVVKLGKQRYEYLFDKLKKYNSDLFTVDVFEKSRPNCDYEWGYSFQSLEKMLSDGFDKQKYDMCIGFVDTIIENNYFGKRLRDDYIYAVSFYQVSELLKEQNIEVFNFMLATIYRYVTRYKIRGEYLTHDETKGCIFDMCGDKRDIVFLCNHPIICEDCMVKMRSTGIESDYVKLLQKEIKRIHKSNYYIIAEFIQKHPYISIVIGVLTTTIINVISCFIYDLIR